MLEKSTVRHVGGEWDHSGKLHWIDCACGQEIQKGEHIFKDNVCVLCGYHPMAWWLWLIIGLGSAALGAAVVVVIFLVKKKKKDGPQDPASGMTPPPAAPGPAPQGPAPAAGGPTPPPAPPEGPAPGSRS